MGIIDNAISGVRRKFIGGTGGGAASAETPLPEIDPKMASQGVRATPSAPENLRPFTGPATTGAGAGEGFTYGTANADRIPNNPSIKPGGMSPEAAAFQAENAAAMGPRTPTNLPSPALDAEGLGRAAGQRVRAALGPATNGLRSTAVPIAAGALSVAPIYHAVSDEDNGLSFADRAQLSARALMQGAGGIVGGAAGGTLGSGVGPVGTVAGGVAGGMVGMKAADALAGGIRRGANLINGALGGDPEYWHDSDEIMKNAGYNPNPSASQLLQGNPRTATNPAGGVPTAAASAPPAANPAVENPYGGIDGIEGVTKDGVLSLRNTRAATPENQDFMARANVNGLRAGDLAAGSAYTANVARRNQELTNDEAQVQRAWANRAASEAAAAKGISDFNDGLKRTGPGLAGGLSAPAQDDDLMRAGIAAGGGPLLQAATSLRESRDRNATTLAQAHEQSLTQARGQDLQASTARENNAALRDQARATLGAAQMQRQWEHEKFGIERGDKLAKEAQDQRLESETHMQKALEGIAPRMKNDKGELIPDQNFIQSRMSDLTHTLGLMAQDPKIPAAARKTIAEKGFAGLDEGAKQALLQAAQMKQRHEETRSLLPGGSDGPASQDLRAYVPAGSDDGTFYDTVKLAGGQTIRKANATHAKPANFLLPDWGNPETENFGVRRK